MGQGLSHAHVVKRRLAHVDCHSDSSHWIVVVNLALLDEATLNSVDVTQLLHPKGRIDGRVVVEVSALEHLEGELLVADDDFPNLVEVVRDRRCVGTFSAQ